MSKAFLVGVDGIILIAAALMLAPPAGAVTNVIGSITLHCDSLSINLSYEVNRDNTGQNSEFYGYFVFDGANRLLYSSNFVDRVGAQFHDNGTVSYAVQPQFNPITAYFVSHAGNGLSEDIIYTTSYECPGLPYNWGEDMVPIPPSAAVGQIVTDTAIYAEPNFGAATLYSLAAGKTIWIFGLDETGQFYKGMLAGRFFWVPKGVVGPNYDAVWDGQPLPTNTVH